MVEFAIVPDPSLLVFGIIQFGILFNHSLTLTDAVRAVPARSSEPDAPERRCGGGTRPCALGSSSLTEDTRISTSLTP